VAPVVAAVQVSIELIDSVEMPQQVDVCVLAAARETR
jgi:hypothetical protein